MRQYIFNLDKLSKLFGWVGVGVGVKHMVKHQFDYHRICDRILMGQISFVIIVEIYCEKGIKKICRKRVLRRVLQNVPISSNTAFLKQPRIFDRKLGKIVFLV